MSVTVRMLVARSSPRPYPLARHLPAADAELHQVFGRGVGHVGGVEPGAGVHALVQVGLLGVDVAIEVDDADFFAQVHARCPAPWGSRWSGRRPAKSGTHRRRAT